MNTSKANKILSLILVFSLINLSGLIAQMVGGRQNNQASVKEVKAGAITKGAATTDVNLFNGTMNSSYTLGSVSTPAGLSFTLSSSYSSTYTSGGETTISSGIPYGEGWTLNIPTITITSEAFTKYTPGQIANAASSDTDPDCLNFNTQDALKEGNIVWFEPIINIPGVISERFVYKYTCNGGGPQSGHVFVPAKFNKYVEAVFNDGEWTVTAADGTEYNFKTSTLGYRTPSNQRVYRDDQNTSSSKDLTQDAFVLKQLILPKEEVLTFYCNNITNRNMRNGQWILFNYEKFGKFNYFKEYSDLMFRLRSVLGQFVVNPVNSPMGTPVSPDKRVPEFDSYKDILLVKITSQTRENNAVEELVLNYRTLLNVGTKDMLSICENGVHRLDSLYNYKTVWSNGIDSPTEATFLGSDKFNQPSNSNCVGSSSAIYQFPTFNDWVRYNHSKSDQAIINFGLNNSNINMQKTNPYKASYVGSCQDMFYNRNKIANLNDLSFNHSFLESPRIGLDFPPGDIYEINTLIYNPYASNGTTYSKSFCNFDINLVSGDNTSSLAQSDIASLNSGQPLICASDCDSRRYHSLFTTFNNAIKWNSAGKATLTNVNDPYLKTSNLFVMPNLPDEYQGFHIQIGPGNSDSDYGYDYNTQSNFSVIGSARNAYYNSLFDAIGGLNTSIAGDIEPSAKIPHNFGIGMPWHMVDWLTSQLDNGSIKPNEARYKFWWFDKTMGLGYDQVKYPNVPTAADASVLLKGIEMIRYSKNPYMLTSVQQYKTNGINDEGSGKTTGRVLVNQLQFEYEVQIEQLVNNRGFISGSMVMYQDNKNHWVRNVFLLKKIIEIPVNGSKNKPISIIGPGTNLANFPKTEFFYQYNKFTNGNGTTRSVNGFYCLNKIIDNNGGETSYEYYPLNDPNTSWSNVVNWDLLAIHGGSSFYSPLYANPSTVQNIYKIELAVKRKIVNNGIKFTIRDWLYEYSNRYVNVGISSKGGTSFPLGNNYKVSNAKYDNGLGLTIVRSPLLVNAKSRVYTSYEHYTAESDYLIWGKLKSVNHYDENSNLINSEVYEYSTSKAYQNGMYRTKPTCNLNDDESEYSELSEEVPAENLMASSETQFGIHDFFFNMDFLETKSPNLFTLADKNYLHSFFVRLSKETKTEYDYYIGSPVIGLTDKSIPEGFSTSLKLATEKISIPNNSSSNSVSTQKTIDGSQNPVSPVKIESISKVIEYEYWDADHNGITTSNGYKKLAALNNVKLRFEPSWEVFKKKSYSPQLPDSYVEEEFFYYYDLVNDIGNFDKYDLFHFGQGSGGNVYNSNFPALFHMFKNRVRNLPYEGRTTSKAPCQAPVAVSNYHIYDVSWKFDDVYNIRTENFKIKPNPPVNPNTNSSTGSLVTGKSTGPNSTDNLVFGLLKNNVLLKYSASQIDTVRIDSAYSRLYNVYHSNLASKDIVRFKPIYNNDVNQLYRFTPEFPFDTLLMNYIDERENNGLISLEHNGSGLYTSYKYSRPSDVKLVDPTNPSKVAWVKEFLNYGEPIQIVTGCGFSDSLVTKYEYNPDYTISKITTANGETTQYEYDVYSRLISVYSNGLLTKVNKYSFAYNMIYNTNLSFSARAALNYVESFIFLDTSQQLKNIAEHSRIYFDPLGRKYDMVSQICSDYSASGSPAFYSTKSIHTGQSVFDNWDRVIKQFNTFVENSAVPQMSPTLNPLGSPYNEQKYESNHRSQVLRSARCGENINSGHTQNSIYRIINGADLANELKDSDNPDYSLTCNRYNPSFKFVKTVILDEDGKKTISYQNALGQQVAVKTYISNKQTAITKLYYDSYGQQVKVINPNGQEYRYEYNLLGQQYHKYSPDKGNEYKMFNASGQVVLEQDMNARVAVSSNGYAYVRKYTYDVLGRLVKQERCKFATLDNPLTYLVFPSFDPYTVSKFSFATTIDRHFNWYKSIAINNVVVNTPISPYSLLANGILEKEWFYGKNQPTITTANYSPKIINFLSQSNANPFNAQTNLNGELAQTYSYNNAGVLNEIRIFSYNTDGTDKWEITQFDNGTVKIPSIIKYPEYNLRGSVKAEYVDYGLDGDDIQYNYTYDGWGRLTETYVNKRKIASFLYDDALGLVKEIKYFENCSNGVDYSVDTISYNYDIRDRLTEIKSHLYNEKLYYDADHPQGSINDATTVTASQNFNGNINGISHKYFTDRITNTSSLNGMMDGETFYGYTYDGLNRLVNADASVMNVLTPGQAALNDASNYGDENYNFDKVGNIINFKRGIYYKPIAGSTTANWVQKWHYNYNAGTNRLVNIDSNGVSIKFYTYDNNGNVTSDNSKKLSNIEYTRNNLPYKLTFGNGTTVTKEYNYEYDINDNRIYKKDVTGNSKEEYNLISADGKILGTLDLKTNTWSWFVYGKHRIAEINGNTKKFFEYDHLGNTRVTYTATSSNCLSSSVQYTLVGAYDYFASGKQLRSFKGSRQEKFLNTYHEFDEESDLEYSGARYLDREIGGRFLSVDPLEEERISYTPYNYCLGNPILRVDEDGRKDGITILGANGSSITIQTDLVDINVDASALGIDFGGNYNLSGDEVLGAILDIAGIFDPTGLADGANAALQAKQGNYFDCFISVLGVAPYVGDLAKTFKIKKDIAIIEKAIDAIKASDKAKELTKVADEVKDVSKNFIGCFVIGTLILTDNGLVPIEKISKGSKVWAYSDSLNKKALQIVLNTTIKPANKLIFLRVGATEIVCTPDHPFFINKKWFDAKDVNVGDSVSLFNNTKAVITYKLQKDTVCKVYNFAVSNYHTYFVSEIGVLVHNNNPCAMPLPGKTGPPNPHGKKGGLAHQNKVNEVADKLKKNGYEVTKEVKISTPGGSKSKRYVDVQATKNGKTINVQVGKKNKNGTSVSRERKAKADIDNANKGKAKGTVKTVIVHYN